MSSSQTHVLSCVPLSGCLLCTSAHKQQSAAGKLHASLQFVLILQASHESYCMLVCLDGSHDYHKVAINHSERWLSAELLEREAGEAPQNGGWRGKNMPVLNVLLAV